MSIDPEWQEKLDELQKTRESEKFWEKLQELKLSDVMTKSLQKVLSDLSERENQELLKILQKYGGEPSESWEYYYDQDGLHQREVG